MPVDPSLFEVGLSLVSKGGPFATTVIALLAWHNRQRDNQELRQENKELQARLFALSDKLLDASMAQTEATTKMEAAVHEMGKALDRISSKI